MSSTLPTLAVPTFRRLDEYFGSWMYEPSRFAGLWRTWKESDLRSHVMAGPQPATSTYRLEPARGDKSVAVIELNGTLMKQQPSIGGTSTIQARRHLRTAVTDSKVSAILLGIDSPGGTVAGTEDLAAAVQAANRVKPVWSLVNDLCASAAYWVGSQAAAMFANAKTALIGSIGTLMVVYDASGMAEREGVKVLAFKTGPLKGAGVFGTPVTDEQSANFQATVEKLQQQFDAGVMAGRGMTAAQLKSVRTGGVFTATEALSLKLIDGIKSSDQVLKALAAAS